MTPELHRAKAERIRRTLAKLRPSDYEMRIDGAMLAANHYVNLALHVLGIRPEAHDIIHTEFLEVIDYRRFEVAASALIEALEAIEELRAPFVRGAAPNGIEAGERALHQLARVEQEALKLRPIGFPMPKYTPDP
jgi:hypothetical protein